MTAALTALHLTTRDLAILDMVHTYRGCMTDQIHLRFWSPGSALSACYRRVAYLNGAGYLKVQRLPSLSGVGSGKRFVTLGPKGRLIVADRHGIAARAIGTQDCATPLFVQHHTAIGDFRLALELATETAADVSVLDWTEESTLRRRPIRIEDPGEGANPRSRIITLVPDGAFTLLHASRRQRCFFEMDMGTIAPKRLQLKVRGYLSNQVGTSTPVFVVTTTNRRAERIAHTVQAQAKKLSRDPSLFFITTRDRITPHTVLFLPIWQQIGVAECQPIIRSIDGPYDMACAR